MYYELLPDSESAKPKLVANPAKLYPEGDEVDLWAFLRCQRIADTRPVPFQVLDDGPAHDHNDTTYGALVVSRRLADLLEEIASEDIQLVPVNFPAHGEWLGLNILAQEGDVFDHGRSIIKYHKAGNPKAGRPDGVIKMVLDPSKLGKHKIFRLGDWIAAVVVSDAVKLRCEAAGMTNMSFRPVTPARTNEFNLLDIGGCPKKLTRN